MTATMPATIDLKSHSVDDLRQIAEQNFRRANEKKEDLRQYVGIRYRDLLLSADAIINMNRQCQHALTEIKSLTSTLASLPTPHRQLSLALGAETKHPVGDKSSSHTSTGRDGDRLIALASQVSRAPERIWGLMDNGEYTRACKVYFGVKDAYGEVLRLAEGVVSDGEREDTMGLGDGELEGEKEGNGRAIVLFVMQHWSCVQGFPGRIYKKCLQALSSLNLNPDMCRDALNALALVSPDLESHANPGVLGFDTHPKPPAALKPSITAEKLLDILLQRRFGLIRAQLEAGTQIVLESESSKGSMVSGGERIEVVGEVLGDVTRAVTRTLEMVAAIFILSTTPPLDSLYQPTPQTGTQNKSTLPLPPKKSTQARAENWMENVKTMISKALPQLLSTCVTGGDMERAREAVLEVLNPEGGGGWERAVGVVVSEIWGRGVVEGNEGTVLWDGLFGEVFCERSKEIISTQFSLLEIQSIVSTALETIFPQVAQNESPNPDDDPDTSADSNKTEEETEGRGILWEKMHEWEIKVAKGFEERVRTLFSDICKLLTISHPKILSLTRVVRFELKPKVQRETTKAMAQMVHRLRKCLRDLEASALTLDRPTYLKTVDQAAFIARVALRLTSLQESAHTFASPASPPPLSASQPSSSSEPKADGSMEEKSGDAKSDVESPVQFLADTLSAAGLTGARSLLGIAFSGFQTWAQASSQTLIDDFKAELTTFLIAGKFHLNLANTWEAVEAKGAGRVPFCPSTYASKLLLAACTDLYRICGPEVRSGFLAIAKLELATQTLNSLKSILSPYAFPHPKPNSTTIQQEDEKEQKLKSENLDNTGQNLGKSPMEFLSQEVWKQVLFDAEFLFTVLSSEASDGDAEGSSSFSLGFVTIEAADDLKACEQVKKSVSDLIRRQIDPIELEFLNTLIPQKVERFLRQSYVLYGALGVSKPKDKDKKQRKRSSTGTPRDTMVVRVASLADPIDHIPLLPTSLYPKRKTVPYQNPNPNLNPTEF
ncbi:hypothetical protein AAMO2058_000941700 [Amorphochlora amoebiformis]